MPVEIKAPAKGLFKHLNPPSARTMLNETRRRSWFGLSQEPQECNKSENSNLVMNPIKDINNEECDNFEPENQSWWSLKSWKFTKENDQSSTKGREDCTGHEKRTTMDVKTPFPSMAHQDSNSPNIGNSVLRQRKQNGETINGSQDTVPDLKKHFALQSRSAISPLADDDKPQFNSKRRSTIFKDLKLNKQAANHPTMVSLPARLLSLDPAESSRSMQRRATIHYSSSGSPAFMDFNRRTAYTSLRANEIRAMDQMKDVCRDYVVYRLRQRNLVNRVSIDREQTKERWLFKEVLFIEKELERSNKCRFSDISKQIGVTLRSEDILRKVFFELSSEIITTEIEKSQHRNNSEEHESKTATKKSKPKLVSLPARNVEITWGRIFAVLAVAGGLAVDCVLQGHADLVNYIIEYVGEFSRVESILPWITDQGGWEALKGLTYEISPRRPPNSDYFFTNMTNMTIAIIFCAIGAFFVATIFIFGDLR